MTYGSKFTLLNWHTTEMGRWWGRQLDRVDHIINTSEDKVKIRVAQKQRTALISYLDEVEEALEIMQKTHRGRPKKVAR